MLYWNFFLKIFFFSRCILYFLYWIEIIEHFVFELPELLIENRNVLIVFNEFKLRCMRVIWKNSYRKKRQLKNVWHSIWFTCRSFVCVLFCWLIVIFFKFRKHFLYKWYLFLGALSLQTNNISNVNWMSLHYNTIANC